MNSARLTLTLLIAMASVLTPIHPTDAADVAPLAAVSQADERWGINHIYGQTRLQQLAKDAGASWNRWEFRWADIETQRGRYQFATYDTMVTASIANGFDVHGILISVPDWAIDQRTGLPSGLQLAWNDQNNLWGKFVRETASHYRGKIRHWEIWNEPDYREIFWGGTTADYYQLLKVAYLSVKSVDSSAQVLMGGLAYWPNPGFLPEILNYMVTDPIGKANNYFFDILPYHTYSRPSDAYDRVVQGRQHLVSTIGPKPVWINETNVPAWDESPVQNFRPYAWASTTSEQASYVIQTFAYGLAAGADKVSVYRLQDTEWPEAYGLLRNDGSTRPAYVAFQVAAKHLSHVSSAALQRQGDLEQVVMQRPGERVSVVWNKSATRLNASIGAMASTATLVSQTGTTTQVKTTAGQYKIELPAATANNGASAADYIIGGTPFILIESLPANMQTAQETNSILTYSGNWEAVNAGGPSSGAVRRAAAAGQGVAVEFADSSITWVTSKGPDRGIARVEVDGVLQGEIDLYSPTEVWEVPFTFGDFASGGHRLTVSATGRRSPQSLGAFVDVDQIVGLAMRAGTPPSPPSPVAVVQTAGPAGHSQAASYSGVTPSATRVALPVVMRARSGWTTLIAIESAGDSAAPATIKFANEQGAEVATRQVTLNPNGSTLVDPRSTSGLADGFVGSAFVESAQPIAASVTQIRDGSDALSYSGVSAAGERLYVPLLFKRYNGWDTGLQVQNLADTSVSVAATYQRTNGPGGPWRETAVIAPRSAHTFYQPANSSLPDGFVGSAIVESPAGSRIAAVVNELHSAGNGSAYEAATGGSATVSAPLLFKNSGGWNTGLQVQNVGNTGTNVTVTYQSSDGRGGPWMERTTVEAGGSATFYQPANAELPDGFVGSATVTSTNNQPLVAIVNEVHTGRSVAMTYRTLSDSPTSLVLPYMARNDGGWNTGLQVQNMGSEATTVYMLLQDEGGVLVHRASASVPAGASRTFYLPSLEGVPEGWRGSAAVMSSPAQPLGAIVNETRY